MSEPSSADRDPFEVVAESFLARFRSGQRPSIDEYAARHPELADQIRELLPALVMVEQDLTIDRDPAPSGSRPPLPPATFKERRLGDYRILREVGRGGMGVVYEAEQVSLGRRVALKVLPGHHSSDGLGLERFRREAKAAARLHHTNIVPVFEVGSDGDVAYYAMQFIQGQGLDQVIDELTRLRDHASNPGDARSPGPTEAVAATGTVGPAVGRIAESLLIGRIATEALAPIPDPATADPEVTERIDRDPTRSPGLALASRGPSRPHPGATSGPRALLPGGSEVSTTYLSGRRATFFRSVAGIGRQAAQGLAYAHAGGIVHRDIKPSNLLLDHAGVVWIADFGLAKADDDGLTQSGDILGTLRYMAPERFRGAGDARADIYALGMTLYELLTLRPAHESADRLRLIERIKNEEPVRPRLIDPRIPRDLETIVLKAMDKLPERRYASAEALSEDLRRFLADEPIKARQISTSERYWRWARRNPVVATLGGVLSALLVMVTIGSLLTAAGFARLAEDARKSAIAEGSAHRDADREREAADSARIAAQKAEDEMRKLAAVAEARKLVAERESRRAEGEKKRAEEQLARSEELVYAGKLMLAQNDFEAGNGGLALHYLDECQASLRGWEFRHLWGRINARQTLVGHTGVVYAAAFSPDGSRIATGSWDGTARVWDAATAEPIFSLKGHRGSVLSVAFSPDGKRLVTSGGEWSLAGNLPGDVKVWDVETGRQLLALEGHSYAVWRAVFSPDGSRILTGAGSWGTGPGEAKIWDAETGREVSSLNGYSGSARSVAYSPDGRRLVVGANNETASVRDASTGQQLLVLRNRGTFRSLAFSPDGRRIVAGLDDGMTKVWDAETGRELLALKGRGPWVNSAAFSPDGRRIVTGSAGQTASVWDAETGQELFDLKGHSDEVKSVSFSPDGRRVLTGSQDATARVWDAETGQQVPVLRGHGDFVSSIAFSPDGGRIVTASGDGTARVWDAATARQLLVLKLPGVRRGVEELRLYAAAFSPDGRRIVAGGGDGTARVWDAATGRQLLGLEHSNGVACAAFSPDGRRIVTGTHNYEVATPGNVKVWDAETGRELLTLQRRGPGVHSVKFSPDGSRILSGSQDGKAKVYDAATGRELLVLAGHAGAVKGVAFRRDGRRILTGGLDQTARVWDAETGRELLSLRGHTAEIQGVAFSPAGDRIVTGSVDRSAKVWDAETGQELLAFKGQRHEVLSVAFSPDGQRIAAGIAGANATASVWYAGRGQEVLVLEGQGEPLSRVAFSPDGERIFGWDTQKRIMAWSAADGRPIDPRNPPAMPPPGPARSADGFLRARPEGKTIVVTDRRPPSRDNAWPLPDATERERHRVELARSLRRGEVEQARILVNSGVAAFREGRLADANVRLRQASERLQALREEFPDDPLLAPLLGISHGFLASTLQELKRPGEALAHARESLSILESIHDAGPNELFNMACGCAMLSTLEDRASPADREKLQARGVDYLRLAVEGDRAGISTLIPTDRDLDPLRSRADFRGLLADLAFPRDPFRQPSPLALFESFSSGEKRELEALSAEIALEPSSCPAWRSRGGFLARRGAWPAAAADYRRALDLNPPSKWAESGFDNVFALESSVALLRAGDVDGHRRLARTMLDRFGESNNPSIADAVAKVNSLLPPPDQDLGRLGRVAQRAVDAGQGDGILPWCLLVRGMAAYRAGDFAGAVEWLDKAGVSSPGPDHRAATLSYQAMASSRLGRAETARALLAKAAVLTASRVAQKDVGGAWHDFWIAELARREAEALVNPTQPQTARPVGP